MASKMKFEIEATTRHDIGKGASRRLRHAEKVPGVVYGGGTEPVSITLAHKDLNKSLENEAFYSHILSLKLDGNVEKVVLKDLQRHPWKPRILHADFQRVRHDVKLHMHVPVHFLGAENSPGVNAGGSVSHLMNDIEVACLPDDLPEYIEIDISNMALNDSLHLSDLKLPKGVEIVALAHGDDKAVVSIHMPRVVEDTPLEIIPPSEVPATSQKGDAENKPE